MTKVRHGPAGREEPVRAALRAGAEALGVPVRVLPGTVRLPMAREGLSGRLRETRPIWEGMLQRLTAIEAELQTFNRQLRTVVTDLFNLRVRVEKLEDEQPAR